MLFFNFLIVEIFSTHNIFVVPDNDNANVYITLKQKDLPGSYIIRELNEENCVNESVKTNNQRLNTEDKTKLHYFNPITLEERRVLEHILNCYKTLNFKDRKKVEMFLKGDVLAVAKIQTYINYSIGVMKSKNFVTVDKYLNSKKFKLDKFPKIYSLEFYVSYDSKENQMAHFIPCFYKNALLKNQQSELQNRVHGRSEEYLNERSYVKNLKNTTIDTIISEIDNSFKYQTPEEYHKNRHEVNSNTRETHEEVRTAPINRSRLNGLFSSVQNLLNIGNSSNQNDTNRRNRRNSLNSPLNRGSRF
ncbi:uncharacterized protein VNE69_08114 [Vairimorpha necatrix]|uniref:Uncharacterized protein n=1 Tax=Vairimorpha necatrix TaxID=6039 RepID=A0AAX4JEU7_9MICR